MSKNTDTTDTTNTIAEKLAELNGVEKTVPYKKLEMIKRFADEYRIYDKYSEYDSWTAHREQDMLLRCLLMGEYSKLDIDVTKIIYDDNNYSTLMNPNPGINFTITIAGHLTDVIVTLNTPYTNPDEISDYPFVYR